VCSSLQEATAEHLYSNPTNWWGFTAPVAKIKLSDGDGNLTSPGFGFSVCDVKVKRFCICTGLDTE